MASLLRYPNTGNNYSNGTGATPTYSQPGAFGANATPTTAPSLQRATGPALPSPAPPQVTLTRTPAPSTNDTRIIPGVSTPAAAPTPAAPISGATGGTEQGPSSADLWAQHQESLNNVLSTINSSARTQQAGVGGEVSLMGRRNLEQNAISGGSGLGGAAAAGSAQAALGGAQLTNSIESERAQQEAAARTRWADIKAGRASASDLTDFTGEENDKNRDLATYFEDNKYFKVPETTKYVTDAAKDQSDKTSLWNQLSLLTSMGLEIPQELLDQL